MIGDRPTRKLCLNNPRFLVNFLLLLIGKLKFQISFQNAGSCGFHVLTKPRERNWLLQNAKLMNHIHCLKRRYRVHKSLMENK